MPESIIRRRFAAEIRKEVIDSLLPERFNRGVNELNIRPVGQPQVTELTVEDGTPLHVKAVFEFIPAFSIDGYKDVKVAKPSVEVTDEEFQHELGHLRDSRATIEPVEEDRPLQDGDWAEITYKGQIQMPATDAAPDLTAESESAPAAPAESEPIGGENTLVEIGGKDTVEAFTNSLRGAKPGQELKVEVIYPADYAEAKLAGKTVAPEARRAVRFLARLPVPLAARPAYTVLLGAAISLVPWRWRLPLGLLVPGPAAGPLISVPAAGPSPAPWAGCSGRRRRWPTPAPG